MDQASVPDRDPIFLYDDAVLIEEATAPDLTVVTTFHADDRHWRAVLSYGQPIPGPHDDHNDADAVRDGYDEFWRICAIDQDGLPHALWEVYVRNKTDVLSKAIQVDHRCKGKGIGSRFALALRKAMKVQWSGYYTGEGLRLKTAVERLEALAALDEADREEQS